MEMRREKSRCLWFKRGWCRFGLLVLGRA